MPRNIDIRAMTAEAFGYSPLRRFDVPTAPLGTEDRLQVHPAGGELHGSAGRGLLGLPVFSKVVFQPFHHATGGFEGLELLDPLITVAQPQNIITTSITGRNGTVKEYIGQGDFAVTIRAILATDPFAENRFDYPLANVQLLREMISLGLALPVSGWLLDTFGITNLVIQNPTYESLPGFTNLQAIELQCLSDEPIELTL